MRKSEVFDRASRYANILLIIVTVILLFINLEVAIGFAVGALLDKSLMSFNANRSTLIFWAIVLIIVVLLYMMLSLQSLAGFLAALVSYVLARFLFTYIIANMNQ